MLKVNSKFTYNKVCANYCALLQRLTSTECNHVKQNHCVTNACEIDNVKPYDAIPGPKPAPIFGYLWHLLPIVGKYYGMEMHKVHIGYQKEYGDLVRLRELKVAKDILLVYNPKDIETVFRSDNAYPNRGDTLLSIKYYRDKVRPEIFGGYGGVFTSNNEAWQEARSVMNAVLMHPRVVKHYINPFQAVVDDFIERIRYLANKNELHEMPADFNKELLKWALESVGILSLDTRFGLLESNTPLEADQLQYIEDVGEFFVYLYKLDILPSFARLFNTGTWKGYVRLMDRITGFIRKHMLLSKARLEKEGYQFKDENDMSVLEKLLKNYDHRFLLGNVMDILLGGVDTTGRTMGGILYLLASNPDKQEILRQEVNKVLINRDDVLTIKKLEQMPYLRAVIKEGMRLFPLTFGVSRLATKDMVLSGYHVPKGTYIIMEQIPLVWNEDHFPDADKFKPERWLRKGNKAPDVNPWVMLSFGFGPRACVGKRVAQLELELLLAKIMRNFRMEWHHGKPTYGFALLFGITSPLKIRMIETEK